MKNGFSKFQNQLIKGVILGMKDGGITLIAASVMVAKKHDIKPGFVEELFLSYKLQEIMTS